jgi:ubiquinone/menaquinone biosynthesis C-methylase UbiE/cytosine/adenosine deaminase-related metal-dependent hydrolase
MTTLAPVFDRWATVYDTQPNPLLLLEQRTLPALMPPVLGIDVLDVGCGTGRWLQHFETFHPASVTGTDPSPAMLLRARAKLTAGTTLTLGDATSLPCADESIDLILASFVLSYIADLQLFAAESARVLRPGGHLLISDIHPVTTIERAWTRSFHADGKHENITAINRPLQQIISIFQQHGFTLCHTAEPSFESPERPTFEEANKLAAFEQLTNIPAIYLLKFQKQAPTIHLTGAPSSTGPETWNPNPIQIHNARISNDPHPSSTPLDLNGYVLLPGLINAHDHLEFALFPNLGRTLPYNNATEWATDIHQQHAATIKQHLKVPLDTRLQWGAIRNLLCGVTTVCHHNPLPSPSLRQTLPIRLIEHFGWAHSLTFDRNLSDRFHSTPTDQPFILHAAEGTDPSSRDELDTLDHLHLLDPRTVLVHGLACTPQKIELLNQRGTGLILCPTSNLFLFNRALTNPLIAALDRVALGSDSPLTARGDLLDEVHYLHTVQHVSPTTLYHLVTTNAASLLRLTEGQGTLLPNSPADLVAVKDQHHTPAQTLAALTFADIELVLLAGQVQLASSTLYNRLPEDHRTGLHLLTIEGHQRWIRADLPALFASAEAVLGQDKLRLGGKEVHHLHPH